MEERAASDVILEAGQVRGDSDRLRLMLERELRSTRWREGQKLPTERELGERYGVSRNTVRRALDALEESKLIIRHVGRGTFKAGHGAAAHVDFAADALSPADVVECRLVFEPELAALVAARANQRDFDRMDDCVQGCEMAEDVASFEKWDAGLHDAIACATHNRAVVAMSRALAQVRHQAEWGVLKARHMTADRKTALQAHHRAIVGALRKRDKVEARATLREHILYVRAYMFGD